jgi:small neutral amino acid transporter SnatA (MarC family)
MRALLTVLVAVNPPAIATALPGRRRRDVMAVAAALATTVTVGVAALSAPMLDALDVTPATFRVAAAVVLGVAGARWLAFGPWRLPEIGSGTWRLVVVPLLVPVLLTPQLVAVSISVGSDHGAAVVLFGAAVAMALVWVVTTVGPATEAWSAGARFVGMVAVVVAVALAVDGVRSV